jgi:hypothetical protein
MGRRYFQHIRWRRFSALSVQVIQHRGFAGSFGGSKNRPAE